MIGFRIHYTMMIRVVANVCILTRGEYMHFKRKEGWYYELDETLRAWFYEQEIRPILYIVKNSQGLLELWVRFQDDADTMAYKLRWG
jgi:hypothetical protein